MNRVTSHGLASADDPAVRNQLQQKFPDRVDVLPDTVPKVKPIEAFGGLRESLLKQEVKRGTSVGCL